MRNASPLRYPGGKWRIAPFFERLIQINGLSGCCYLEPYAGGSSLALSLLLGGHVSKILLNDLDPGEIVQRFGAEGEGPSLYIQDPDGNVVELKGPAVI